MNTIICACGYLYIFCFRLCASKAFVTFGGVLIGCNCFVSLLIIEWTQTALFIIFRI